MSLSFSQPDALVNPTPTKAKREKRFREVVRWKDVVDTAHSSPTLEIPALDVAGLSNQYREYGLAPVWKEGTFRAPLNATWAQYEKIRDAAIKKFVAAMSKQGWALVATETYRPRVSPGVYPAHDLLSGYAILDQREFIIGMWFKFENPKPVRIELPPHLVSGLTITR